MDYFELLEKDECNFLDFKVSWYDNNADLVLDILSLANSDSDTDKYIVLGIEDKTKTIFSIKNDINRKSTENLNSLIRDSKFNIKPLVTVKTINKDGNEIDIIEIKKTCNRPYFLLEDKKHGKTFIRAGVIYTRDADSNTPQNSTASEYQIARMWEERFGLNLSPEERFNIYVKDYINWKQIDYSDTSYKFYSKFPEFTVGYFENDDNDICHEEWCKYIGASYNRSIFCKYHTTIIKKLVLVSVDDRRYNIVSPEWVDIYYKNNLSEIIPIQICTPVPEQYKIDDLIDSSKYNVQRVYFHVRGSFDFNLQKLFNSEKQLDYFYKRFKHGKIDRIHLIDENSDIPQACKKIFLSSISPISK